MNAMHLTNLCKIYKTDDIKSTVLVMSIGNEMNIKLNHNFHFVEFVMVIPFHRTLPSSLNSY